MKSLHVLVLLKNYAHIVACHLKRGDEIKKKNKNNNLTEFKSNLRNNKKSGRKYRDNEPEKSLFENIHEFYICNLPKRKHFPGILCDCKKWIHNRCKSKHKC